MNSFSRPTPRSPPDLEGKIRVLVACSFDELGHEIDPAHSQPGLGQEVCPLPPGPHPASSTGPVKVAAQLVTSARSDTCVESIEPKRSVYSWDLAEYESRTTSRRVALEFSTPSMIIDVHHSFATTRRTEGSYSVEGLRSRPETEVIWWKRKNWRRRSANYSMPDRPSRASALRRGPRSSTRQLASADGTRPRGCPPHGGPRRSADHPRRRSRRPGIRTRSDQDSVGSLINRVTSGGTALAA